MTLPFRTVEDYELFLYTLKDQFPSIRRSTVTLVRRGTTLARVVGELYFDHDVRLVIRERLIYTRAPLLLDGYGYEVWRADAKLYWYDSQPHPHEPALQATHPHHKHVPPAIKEHRISAPGMSFQQPNLPILISEIEHLLQEIESETDRHS